MTKAFTISSRALARCPYTILSVDHWNEDGTCKCHTNERPIMENPFDRFAQAVKDSVEDYGRGFTDAADDWPSLFIVGRDDGQRAIVLVNSSDKDEVAALASRAVQDLDGCIAAQVSSAWLRLLDTDERIEIVMVMVADDDREEVHIARIRRNAVLPPTLAPWEVHRKDEARQFTGRFPDAVRAGLALGRRGL